MKKNVLDYRLMFLLKVVLTLMFYPISIETVLRPKIFNSINKLD